MAQIDPAVYGQPMNVVAAYKGDQPMDGTSINRRRVVVLSVALVVAVAILAWLLVEVVPPERFLVDFVAYWAAGRLNLTGGDPYGAADLFALQQSVGWQDVKPLPMWNPPPTLTLVMPFGLFDFRVGHILWLSMSIGLVVFAADRLWKLFGGKEEQRVVAQLVAFGFVPTLFMLSLSQTSVFVLTGTVGFLVAQQKKRWWWAGAMLPLLLVKPHIVYLLLLAIALWWLRERHWPVAAGAILVLGGAWLIPTLVNPQVNQQYLAAAANYPPFYWVLPTWGTVLRVWFGWDQVGLVFVPPLIGVVLFSLYVWRKPQVLASWQDSMQDSVPWLLLLSASSAAYIWAHDLTVLVPVVIQMAVWTLAAPGRQLRWVMLGALVIFDVCASYLNVIHASPLLSIWMPLVLLVAYWWLQRNTLRQMGGQGKQPAPTV